jgi:hypothetical protein
MDGDTIVTKKRAYDTDKLVSSFPDGQLVYNRLISNCRRYFMRFVNISNDDIPGMIDTAAGYEVDRNMESYDAAYNKVLQWRKNWYALYIETAEEILQNLLDTNSYLKALPTEKPYVDLKSAYSRFYSWTQINQLFHAIHVGTYLWKDTLEKPNSKALYKTLFTYTMV